MSNKDIKLINKEMASIQKQLINQLKTVSIEYIDLMSYYNQINVLKIKKQTIFLNDDD